MKRIAALKMPPEYQPLKFHQFDGKGDPKQHIAHFIETYNHAGTYDDMLVKQLVRSLKGLAFDWYADLASTSNDSWEQMQNEFVYRFYSSRRIVNISELANTNQIDQEPVIEYINRQRAFTLKCKDHLAKSSAVEMCVQGMDWDILYTLQINKRKTFEELATQAHGMELTIACYRRRLQDDESMASSRNISFMLRDSKESKYPYFEFDTPEMLAKLLEERLIELPESKHLQEIGKTNDPKYCRYHRIISHPIEKCRTFKERVMQLANDGKIILGGEDTEQSD